jgi:1-hydroxycarotenoid 3,4-desaturase
VVLDTHYDADQTVAEVSAALGSRAAAELTTFLAYASRIWEAAAPRFVRGPAPTVAALASVSALVDLMAIDPLSTMESAILSRVREPHLRDLLLRFATYVGSDPRRTPATLNCIAHVELGLGGYGIRGGIGALVDALVRVALRSGVTIELGRPVERVEVSAGRAVAVWVGGTRIAADAVIANGEARHVLGELVGRAAPDVPTSTSGFTGVLRARRRIDRAGHTVLFPPVYGDEFVDLFDRGRVPVVPAVYVNAQEKSHARTGWVDDEPLFFMVNAPAEPMGGTTDTTWHTTEAVALDRLRAAGLIDETDPVVWRRDPRGLAQRFVGSAGALYGMASHGTTAAFRRPANRVSGVRGLYLAGGSAHPGGGMPLCAWSGRSAALAASEDAA